MCANLKKNFKRSVKKGQQRYISRVRGGGTPMAGMMKLGTFVDVMHVVKYVVSNLRVISSLRARGGSKKMFPL
jgi:hypothetical protein